MARCLLILAVLAVVLWPAAGHAGAFIFAGESFEDRVTHPPGYDGTGGALTVSVCIDPGSAHAAEMEPAVQNIVATFNLQQPTTPNLVSGAANNVPAGFFDWESVAMHEIGHCAGGLAHPNLASESGLSGSDRNYTKTTNGPDNSFNISPGDDGIKGSADDERGDDGNLHWFRMSNNNPFTIAGTVDSSTYRRDLADLPGGDLFVANADRSVGVDLGFPDSEAVMQQGTASDEAQRALVPDDVATLRYAMAGIDEAAGTADDYTLSLSYAGMTTNCDVVLDFDDSETGFAVCQTSGTFVENFDHLAVTSANIYFNDSFNWFFNDTSCGDGVIDPGDECDDDNQLNGDGCNSACRIETCWNCVGEPSVCNPDDAAVCSDGNECTSDSCQSGTCVGSPLTGPSCDDDNLCTASDTCDNGACVGTAAPRTCTGPPLASVVLVRDRELLRGDPDRADVLVWKWIRGPEVPFADLDDPRDGDPDYTLCVYDESGDTPTVALKAVMPGGETCLRGRACWRQIGRDSNPRGFRYVDRELTPDGILTMAFVTGDEGRTRFKLVARGSNLGLPGPATPDAYFEQDDRVILQLVREDGNACWSSELTDSIRNQSNLFFAACSPNRRFPACE